MSTSRSGPGRTDVPTLWWLTSRWTWAATAVLAGWLVLLVAVTGAVIHGAGFLATLVATVTDAWTVLGVFLAARALAFALALRRRDHDVVTGEVTITDDTSIGAIVSVASFSTIGLLAAAVPFPFLYTTTGAYRLLAIGVAVVVVPISYSLLVYQLGEQLSADRYRRGYRVAPAVYHYLWTLPLVVLAWLLVTGVGPVAVPTGSETLSGGAVHLDAWEVAYAAVWLPTALAFAYAVRRQVERMVRSLVPGW